MGVGVAQRLGPGRSFALCASVGGGDGAIDGACGGAARIPRLWGSTYQNPRCGFRRRYAALRGVRRNVRVTSVTSVTVPVCWAAACELECGWMCTNTPGFSSPSDGSSSVTSVCEIGCGNGRVDYELGEECEGESTCCTGYPLLLLCSVVAAAAAVVVALALCSGLAF